MNAKAHTKYGARVYPPDEKSGRIIIKQTIVGKDGSYVVDGQREEFVSLDDDAAIASAVRAALAGEMKNKSEAR